MIEVKHLNKWYGKHKVIDDINLTVEQGEVVVVIGASGSGKSTLLRCINFLEKPRSGTISIDGREVSAKTKKLHLVRREVGMVFQHFNLFPHMTVMGNVIEGLTQVKGMSRDEATAIGTKMLEKVDMLEKADVYPSMISGGQKQRVAIARALAMNPKIMLFDEPTSALDPMATARIEELVRELKKRYTLVIVTHNMQQAARISDRTAFFLMGDLVEYDATPKMFTSPEDKRTEDYITGRFG